MLSKQIVIVGGVAGGATLAAQIRRKDRQSKIIIFDRGDYISFSNCGLPYYIGGIVENRDDLLFPIEKFEEKYGVEIRSNSEVITIDRANKRIQYKNMTNTKEETYDKLILSPGADAITPDFDGIDKQCTFTLHTIPDMDQMYAFIRENKPTTAAIVGAGFVGMEVVENLHRLGIKCTIIDRSKQVLKIVDKDMASIIQDHLTEKDVNLILEEGLDHFTNGGRTLVLTSGANVEADMTVLALGIKPNTKLATDAGLSTGKTGALLTNHYMQTNDPDIYALGDVVETNDFATKSPRHVALAWPAHRQAFIIASHLNGENVTYKGTLGTAILKVFDLTVSATGHTSHSLKDMGITFKETILQAHSHANYYPGAEKLWLKVLFNPQDGTIYGSQAVGYDGADKRLAVLATAIKAKLTVIDLQDLELGYAPPYGSSKDPVNMIGYKASALLDPK